MKITFEEFKKLPILWIDYRQYPKGVGRMFNPFIAGYSSIGGHEFDVNSKRQVLRSETVREGLYKELYNKYLKAE